MKNIKYNKNAENKENARQRFEAHLRRCQEWYNAGGWLHNSVDYFFCKNAKHYNEAPNLDVDVCIKNGVDYSMVKPISSYK